MGGRSAGVVARFFGEVEEDALVEDGLLLIALLMPRGNAPINSKCRVAPTAGMVALRGEDQGFSILSFTKEN